MFCDTGMLNRRTTEPALQTQFLIMIKLPLFPGYASTRALLTRLQGMPAERFRTMWHTLCHLQSNPPQMINWNDPDEWIGQRLTGEVRETAQHIWQGSDRTLNPRWIAGEQSLIRHYRLAEVVRGSYQLTPGGRTFAASEESRVAREIDEAEGMLFLLEQAASMGQGRRIGFFTAWKAYMIVNSGVKEDSALTEYLRQRLANLTGRGYLQRKGLVYTLTDSGRQYLQGTATHCQHPEPNDLQTIMDRVDLLNRQHRGQLRRHLEQLSPVQFEHLVKALLQRMGYENIVVTAPTNDKGIDVAAVSQHGITTVKEVIQVKRLIKGNVQRTVLDSLRGCLHRYDAFQGTIITLSGFTRGARDAAYEKGAAPITLIDGEKLMDLLVEKQLGVRQCQLSYVEVDEGFFKKVQHT